MNAYHFEQRIYKANIGANEKNVRVFRTTAGGGKVVIADGSVLRIIDVWFSKERAEEVIDKLRWFYLEGQWDKLEYYKVMDASAGTGPLFIIGKLRSIDQTDKWAQLESFRKTNPNCGLQTVTRTEWLKL